MSSVTTSGMRQQSGGTNRLFAIQYLRGIAALLVVYIHFLEQVPVEYRPFLFPDRFFDNTRLKCGVDIFFVISGFIMLVTSRRSSPKEFVIRRAMRIVPLYWILTLVITLLFALRPQLFSRTILDAGLVIKSLLFIPFANPNFMGNLVPVLYPGWTLNFEMYFYAIFALILFAPFRMRVALNGIVFAALLILRYATHHGTSDNTALGIPGDHSLISFYTSPQIFEFWTGMLLGDLYLMGRIRAPHYVALCSVALGFFLLLFNWKMFGPQVADWCEYTLVYLIPSALVVAGALALDSGRDRRPNYVMTLLGDASYSIYLSHILFLGTARAVWRRFAPAGDGPFISIAFACVSMGAAMVGGILIFKLVEKPLLELLQRFYRGRLHGKPHSSVMPAAAISANRVD